MYLYMMYVRTCNTNTLILVYSNLSIPVLGSFRFHGSKVKRNELHVQCYVYTEEWRYIHVDTMASKAAVHPNQIVLKDNSRQHLY